MQSNLTICLTAVIAEYWDGLPPQRGLPAPLVLEFAFLTIPPCGPIFWKSRMGKLIYGPGNTVHMYSGITSGTVLNGELLYTKILEVNLFALYRVYIWTLYHFSDQLCFIHRAYVLVKLDDNSSDGYCRHPLTLEIKLTGCFICNPQVEFYLYLRLCFLHAIPRSNSTCPCVFAF